MRALLFASVASMVDLFNRDNIKILEELGCKVTVAANFTEGSVYSENQAKAFMNELRLEGHDVIDVPVPRSPKDIRGMYDTIMILRREFKKHNYDLLHCQSPIGGVLARMAAFPFRRNGLKVIYYAHGFHFFKGAPSQNWLIYYNLEKLCAKITDSVLTLNKEDYIRAKRHFDTNVRYVPGAGIDVSEIENTTVEDEAALRMGLGISPEKKILLSVCELSYRKNCETMIKAFLKADRDDTVLLLCGIGSQEEMLKRLVRENNAEDKVIFAGFRNDIIKMFKLSDAFVFSSRQEGLPVALMQAMASGVPVVCSKIRGNTDLISENKGGYMYAPEDTDGFAEGINLILDDEIKSRQMAEYNKKAIRKYDISNVNKVMREIYRSYLYE